jgi:hypothetical protein
VIEGDVPFFDKAPTGIPSSGSPDTWVFIGVGVVVAIAIVIGIFAASKRGKRGTYWRDEDA